MEVGEKEKSFGRAEREYLISLLRAGLRTEAVAPAPEGLDWALLYRFARRQLIGATVFPAISPADCPADVFECFKAEAEGALRKELLFDVARSEIFKAFDAQGIEYLPLKGILLKNFYPRKGMRQFADNDFLLREADGARAGAVMRFLGYRSEGYKGVHDVYTKPPVYNFELHRALFNEGQIFAGYFRGAWSRALKEGGETCAYRMTDEDFYVYALAHFQKHYTQGGAGLRSFADLYLMRRNLRLDRAYVQKCLKETGLDGFERETAALAEDMFGDVSRPLPQEVLDYVFASGAYGTGEHIVGNTIRRKGRLRGGIFLAFPPLWYMKDCFPVLRKVPVLLPVFWPVRWVSVLFDGKKRKKAGEAVRLFFRGKKVIADGGFKDKGKKGFCGTVG